MSVRVPDERLDEWVALAAKHASWPEALEAVELRDLAALVADLRAARADNQRLRDQGAMLPFLRLAEATRRLADDAEGVNENIMGNGLAFRRERLRYSIANARAAADREEPRA